MKKIYSFCVLLFYLFLLVVCAKEEEESPIVARDGEAELSIDEVKSTFGKDTIYTANEIQHFVSRWIDNELLYQAALAEGIGSQPEIQDELRRVRRALVINKFLDQELFIYLLLALTKRWKNLHI